MIRKWCNQKEIPTPKTEVGKNLLNNQVLVLRKHIVSQVSSYFPIGGHSENTKTYIRCKRHKNSMPEHKTIGTTTKVLPWNDQ